MNAIDFRLKTPFTAMLVGPTGSGKTVALLNLISQSESVCTSPPVQVVYCYGVWQDAFEPLREKITFEEGMIDVKDYFPSDGKSRWLIIDDLMGETTGKTSVEDLYTKYSHHKNISVIFVSQNLFAKGARTQTLNSHYFFLMKNPRDNISINNFGRQCFAGRFNYFQECYKDATSAPFSYLFVDLTQSTDDKHRLIGNFASQTKNMIVYIPKN